ncbi:MAG TPA: SprT-like domain-containing protein [Candidatus Dojkabacteria bacterium]|nr:SprT-like domain-containing protein [Candidatus Dojkabacteria bacterium]
MNNKIESIEDKMLSIQKFAYMKLEEYYLDCGWTFEWSNTKRTIGDCNFKAHTIRISRFYLPLMSEEELKDTFLHELAHALLGMGYGHNQMFYDMCRKVGCKNPNKDVDVPLHNYRFKAVCSRCGFTTFKNRRNVNGACPKCCNGVYNKKYLLDWIPNCN